MSLNKRLLGFGGNNHNCAFGFGGWSDVRCSEQSTVMAYDVIADLLKVLVLKPTAAESLWNTRTLA